MTSRRVPLVRLTGAMALCVGAAVAWSADAPLSPPFRWQSSPPLITARDVDGWPWHAVKDPSMVVHEGETHLFATVRGRERSHAIVYLSCRDIQAAQAAPRRILPMHAGYCCAPQVFYFTPHRKWYLICQAADPAWGEPAYRAAFSTNPDVSNPEGWSPLEPLFTPHPPNAKIGLDFWVICDATHAHLFSTTNDGRMWRRETALADFPRGWSQPVLALQGDIFEASHTYRIQGSDQYLTIVEAQNGDGWRYYKAYLADRLDGAWRPLAATRDEPFASRRNVRFEPGLRWTDSISHGELVRSGCDERMIVDPRRLQFVYQGVLDQDRQGKAYGEIPWQVGILTSAVP